MEVDHNIQPGDSISVNLESGLVINYTKHETYHAAPLPPQMMNILREGGLVNYLLKYGDYV
jgi:3-isopropylmalate/(R)-2-methylmalate dehydratase small subunit